MNKYAKQLADEYGNLHCLGEELARGGQGVVYRTTDADLAVKQPLNAEGKPDNDINLSERFKNIRLLPLPPRVPVSMPLAILRDEPGYVMRLLNGMKPFSHFNLNGKIKTELGKQPLPQWLTNIPDKNFALNLLHYANTGSTRRRLYSLAKCASILARIHCAGLVYGDISPDNVFVGEGETPDVWLIDADNMRFELAKGGKTVYTPHYGAPEIVRKHGQSRPDTDCWAFAVLAFMTIALCHPFIGKKVLEPEDDNGWDAESAADGAPVDLDEQAYAGFLPFIDDKDDDSNASLCGLPRELTATPELNLLFQETFGAGRTQPHRRPSMMFWALELAKASDKSLYCPNCKMSYFADNHEKCPYCAEPRPAFLRVKTQRWEIIISADTKEFLLPHRLSNSFSFELNDDTEYEALLDFSGKSVQPVRGAKPFSEIITFDFEEAVK
jgi:serine/threonine protein kinase